MGTVRARVRISVSSKLLARIEELPAALGQKIKSGELVAKLDAREIQARFDQAQASLDQAERDWQRASALFDERATTRAERDASEARHRVAKAGLAEAQVLLGYARITAPFDGVVTRKHVEAGDLAQPGRPLIDLEDPSTLQVEAEVPEEIGSSIKSGQQMTVRLGRTLKEIAAQVREIAPTANPASRTFQVKLDLPSGPDLMPGQFARLLVPLGESESLRIPASAVVKRGQLEIVFVVADQRAQMHLVKTGRVQGSEVEVLSGLDEGDQVVTEGADQLLDGQPVALK